MINFNDSQTKPLEKLLPHPHSRIGKTIAITGGKGGIGKSVITSLMAVSLRQMGFRVGILDCDLYAPAISGIFGLDCSELVIESNRPHITAQGTSILSLGLLYSNYQDSLLWKNTLSSNLLKEFWQTTLWGELDFLLLDLPNNSDMQLTVFQQFPLDGLIMVTTPQKAVIQATKNVYRAAIKYQVYTLGIVINMTSFPCPICHGRLGLHDKRIQKLLAGLEVLPILEALPFDLDFLDLCDRGKIEKATPATFGGLVDLLNQGSLMC